MIGIDDIKFSEFFLRTAKAWQFEKNYDFLDFISLSKEQINIIERKDAQMLINGSAGSGKSITLLYKMIKTMMDEKNPQRILYLTFNSTLVSDTYKRACLSKEFKEYKDYHDVKIWTFHKMSYEILNQMGFKDIRNLNINIETIENSNDKIRRRLYPILEFYTDPHQKGYKELDDREKLYSTHDVNFLAEEILWMKANGYIKETDYLEVERNGRGNAPRLTKAQRNTIYKIFLEYERRKEDIYHNDMDLEDYALKLLENFFCIPEELYYDYIFVDEVQDLQAMQLKALAKLTKKVIIIAGDSKQKIYKRSPHSYADLGINVIGGKNRTLTRTYRSTKQIVKLANSLSFADIEREKILDIDQMVDGDMPEIRYYSEMKNQVRYIINQIKKIHSSEEGATIAVIHREEDEVLRRQKSYIRQQLEMNFRLTGIEGYNRKFNYADNKKPIFYTDIYSVKGLEFDYVFIINFDKYNYPKNNKMDKVKKYYGSQSSDSRKLYQQDIQEVRDEEKRLLYVAITRAKKNVFLTYSGKEDRNISSFVEEFDTRDYKAYGFKKTDIKKKEEKIEEELLAIISG